MASYDRIVAKAIASDPPSDAVVVSFDASWYERLRKKAFSAVIRKRVPTSTRPNWLYFHINSPKSAICARARLESMGRLDFNSALKMENKLSLPREDIVAYLGNDDAVGIYWIKDIEFPRTEVSTNQLNRLIVYNPPQSFFFLSPEGKRIIDEMCGFEPPTSHRVRADHT